MWDMWALPERLRAFVKERKASLPLFVLGGGCLLMVITSICLFGTLGLIVLAGVLESGGEPVQAATTWMQPLAKADVTADLPRDLKLECGASRIFWKGDDSEAVVGWLRLSHADRLSVQIISSKMASAPEFALESASAETAGTSGNRYILRSHGGRIETSSALPDGLYLIRMDPESPDGEYEISVSCEPVVIDSPAAVDTPTPTPEAEGLADLHTDEANLAESETPVPPTPIPSLGVGDIQVTLLWESTADLDLHVIDPSGGELYYDNRQLPNGGRLDKESNAICSLAGTEGVENVYWPEGIAPRGEYAVVVHYYAECRQEGNQDFEIVVRVDGELMRTIEAEIAPSETLEVFRFSY